ncbi:hypothetical protein EHLJMEHL_00433 [Vreelandella titanicae]
MALANFPFSVILIRRTDPEHRIKLVQSLNELSRDDQATATPMNSRLRLSS